MNRFVMDEFITYTNGRSSTQRAIPYACSDHFTAYVFVALQTMIDHFVVVVISIHRVFYI